MSNKLLFGGLSLVILVVIGFWLFPTDSQSLTYTGEPAKTLDLPEDSSSSQERIESAMVNTTAQTPSLPDPIEMKSADQVSAQVEDALLQYAELSNYPPQSQPILSEQHIHSFVNTGLPEASHPFPFDDLETPIQLSIMLNQFNYFFGDPIQAQIKLDNVPDQASITARAVLTDLAGEVLAESGSIEINQFSGKVVFDSGAHAGHDWPLEMNLGAYVDVDGHSMFISAPFRINSETAELDSLGFSEPIAENLVIPVNLNVKLAGYYFVAGILYSQISDKPLIHLETEGPLGEGLGSLQLKAHIQALKKGGDEGPYYLDKIRIERWSDEQIPRDVAGKVPQGVYSVEGYSFNDYQDIPYLDPLAEERKRLMQGLSSR